MQKTFKLPQIGLEVELGKYARQADGAAWLKFGNNIVLSTAVSCKEVKEFAGFFPLTVEYRERTSAAGKIPGGYIKREGKLSDSEILISRLIDRPIRPLFPSNYFNEVQILSTVYSYDGKFPSSILAIISSSIALTISKIPFLGPIGAVLIRKVNGKWVFNAGYQESLGSDSNIVIAGTKDGISMVEGYCNNLSESEFIDLLFLAHEQIKIQVDWQNEIKEEFAIQKYEIATTIDWSEWEIKIKNCLPNNFAKALFTSTKIARGIAMDKLREDLVANFDKEIEQGKITKAEILFIFDGLLKEALPEVMVNLNERVDGRSFDQIRPIEIEVSSLPCTHGSAYFRRGETMALASLTLGTAQDAQKVDTLFDGTEEKNFMLHYNFPPFATGEVKMIRGVGRREIGHGHLAESSFYNVLPHKNEFPYTIRSVVDVLESNGSSSMATVCATTMALLDGGIPIKKLVSGIAMGLIRGSAGEFRVLTDILGLEDALGLMDFKVTGTEDGIMAIQMDIKDKSGLTKELLAQVLTQAKIARTSILNDMKKIMEGPRKNLSEFAPRVQQIKVPSDKIGNIIGPSGRTIKEIIANTGTEIDIEDDGSVMVYAKDSESSNAAIKWIKILAGEIEIGATFDGIIRKIAEFGIFVELVPGKDGLVHISNIAKQKHSSIEKNYKIGQTLKVKVVGYDKESGRVSLIAPDLK